MPQISVIVPVYKVEKYIDRCVQSILGQTYADFELILVDDGSPDNSPAMCDAWAGQDSRIRVIHKENGGLSSARNAGMEIAVGEYFHFVDSDDVIHPDCLNILMTCIRRTGAEIAMGRFARFREDTVPADRFTPWDGSWVTRTNLETLQLLFGDIHRIPELVSACGTLWHRHLFDEIQFPLNRLFEDEYVTYQLYHKANKVVFVKDCLYFYFHNSCGITGCLTSEKWCDQYDAQWERIQYFQTYQLSELYNTAVLYFLQSTKWNLISCRKSNDISPQKRKHFEAQYRAAVRIAQQLKLLDFINHYDYYVLAFPEHTFFWRLKRKIVLHLRGKDNV